MSKARTRVLFVDDDSDLCELVQYVMTREGISVDTLTSFHAAEKVMRNYEVLATDYNFGGGPNGIDLAKLFKEGSPNGRVILITGDSSASSVDVDLKLMKPIEIPKLVEVVKKALKPDVSSAAQ